MGQLPAEIPLIDLLRQCIGIDAAAGADCIALTGRDGADAGSADTGRHAALLQCIFHRIDLLQPDKGNLHTLAGGQMHIAFTVFIRNLRNFCQLRRIQMSSHRPHTKGKAALLLLAHKAALFQGAVIHCHSFFSFFLLFMPFTDL